MPRDEPDPKIGAGHASAMFRQGLRELRGAMYPESNVAQMPEYGLYGTRTPGEIAESRRSESLELEEEQRGSVLDERLQQVEASRDVHEREDKDKDLSKE